MGRGGSPSSSGRDDGDLSGDAKTYQKLLRGARKGSLHRVKKYAKRLRRAPAVDLETRSAVTLDRARTALHLACDAGADDVIAWLLKRGADVAAVDADGNTPAHLLARHAAVKARAVERLRKHGASAHARNARGETPTALAERAHEAHAASARAHAERRAERRRAESGGRGLGGGGGDDDGYEGFGDASARAAANEARRWREKLMDAAFAGGEIDEFGGGGGGVEAGESHRAFFESYGDEDDPDAYRWREEEEAYRRYVEEGVRARKRKRVSETLDGNPRRSREDVARAHADATRARDAEAQRVLDDARRQDAEWREKTSRNAAAAAAAADDAAAAAASYRERWGRAAAMIDGGAVNLRLTDVPWPVSARVLTGDAVAAKRALRAALTRGAAGAAESRKMLRTEMLRWHPDKFAGKFGGAIREKDVAEATTRVNVLARLVAELFKEAAAA